MAILDIIVPEYKQKQDFLNKCMKSINVQEDVDWNDIHITIVKDGVETEDLLTIDDFRPDCITNIKDKIDILCAGKHGGPGLTRQYGIEHTKNPYIYFMDSDDELFGLRALNYILTSVKNNPFTYLYSFEFFNQVYHKVQDHMLGALYSLVFRRDVLEKYNIRFLNINTYEDINFISKYIYLNKWQDIGRFFDYPIYIYYVNKDTSISHKIRFSLEKIIDWDIESIIDIANFLNTNNLLYAQENYASFAVFAYFRILFQVQKAGEEYEKTHQEMIKQFWNFYDKTKSIFLTMSDQDLLGILSQFESGYGKKDLSQVKSLLETHKFF